MPISLTALIVVSILIGGILVGILIFMFGLREKDRSRKLRLIFLGLALPIATWLILMLLGFFDVP